MTVASVVGLLLPALDEGSAATVAGGVAVGVAFLLGSRRWLGHHDIHVAGMAGAAVMLVLAALLGT